MWKTERRSEPEAIPVEGEADPALENPYERAERELARELARIGEDGALLVQIARLIGLSRELRQCGYTGQVTLNVGNGLVNSVRKDQWRDWRDRSAGIVG